MGYTVTFHKASADPSSGSYSTITDSTVDGFDDHAELTFEVRLPGGVPHVPEDEQTTFLGGEKSTVKNYRKVWEMTFLSAAHSDNSVNDIEKYQDFLTFVLDGDCPFLWMDMSAYSTASGRAIPWHAANTYIPITVDDWSVAVNEKQGTETLTVTIGHRFRNK